MQFCDTADYKSALRRRAARSRCPPRAGRLGPGVCVQQNWNSTVQRSMFKAVLGFQTSSNRPAISAVPSQVAAVELRCRRSAPPSSLALALNPKRNRFRKSERTIPSKSTSKSFVAQSRPDFGSMPGRSGPTGKPAFPRDVGRTLVILLAASLTLLAASAAPVASNAPIPPPKTAKRRCKN